MNGLSVGPTGGLGNLGTWSVVGTGDFNGDGMWDILWKDSASGNYAIWLMNGLAVGPTGGLGNPGGNWQVIDTGDYDGDGRSDILWKDTNSNVYVIWFMNGFDK
jgi:hypothetical protein